jgi:hypothetical protein
VREISRFWILPIALLTAWLVWHGSSARAKSAGKATMPDNSSDSCPVTRPNGSQPPVKNFGGKVTYSPSYRGSRDGYVEGSHGNGKLWTVLPPDGKLVIPTDVISYHGGLWMKSLWWRGIRGNLTIRGRRLDGAGKLHVAPQNGYGETGLLVTGVTFPSEGCWEITGKADDSELTFVVEVQAER